MHMKVLYKYEIITILDIIHIHSRLEKLVVSIDVRFGSKDIKIFKLFAIFNYLT